jgi:hypothetical protein
VKRWDRMPKLGIHDWESLGRAGALCDQIATLVVGGKFRWSAMVIQQLGEVKAILAALYNKGEGRLKQCEIDRGPGQKLLEFEAAAAPPASEQSPESPLVEE